MALVLAEGNFKDEASVVAASASVAAFADELSDVLISDADVVPALRRAVLRAHDSVLGFSTERVAPGLYATVMGPRHDLCGMGVSVVAALFTSTRVWIASVGECPAWLLREGRILRLNHPHTLANDPAYRAAVRHDPAQAIDFAKFVVTKVLGLTPDPPPFDLTRLDLVPNDKIILGNEFIAPHADLASSSTDCTALELCEALRAAVENEPAPMSVAVLVGAIE